MNSHPRLLFVYWILFGATMAILAISDGPVVIPAIVGGAAGAILPVFLAPRHNARDRSRR